MHFGVRGVDAPGILCGRDRPELFEGNKYTKVVESPKSEADGKSSTQNIMIVVFARPFFSPSRFSIQLLAIWRHTFTKL